MNILHPLTTRLTSHPKLLASTLALAAPIAYLSYLHHSLAQHTEHTRTTGPLTRASAAAMGITIASIPASALDDAARPHRVVHDRAWVRVKAGEIAGGKGMEEGELVTMYLRRTMGLFARRFPQAYMLRAVVPGERKGTFAAGYIEGVGFGVGDVVAGVYRVVAREGGRVEFEIDMDSGDKGEVEGRLVVSVRKVELGENGEGEWEWECSSETAMWVREGAGGMPLEKAAVRWMHELAAWWLLRKGVEYLKGLRV